MSVGSSLAIDCAWTVERARRRVKPYPRAMAIGVGVIGAGLMGSTHARILAAAVAGAEVAAVADVMHETAKLVAMRIGARAEGDPDALIAAPDVDAVVIASPSATHEKLTLACLRAGK